MRGRRSLLLVVLLTLAALPGCAPARNPYAGISAVQYAIPEPEAISSSLLPPPRQISDPRLDDIEARIAALPYNHRPLLYADYGIEAMYLGDMVKAERFLDAAIAAMSSITTGDASAATSMKGSEADKLYKGEPHERALVYLYRGLLYIAQGEPDNANACFVAGALADAMAEHAEDRCDWMTLDVMALQSKRLAGFTDADDWRAFVEKKYGSALPPGWDSAFREPVFIMAASGRAPLKVPMRNRDMPMKLGYVEARSEVSAVRVRQGGKEGTEISLPLADDVYVQAASRGTRNMDAVLAHKEEVKRFAEAMGGLARFGSRVAMFYTLEKASRGKRRDARTGAVVAIGLAAVGAILEHSAHNIDADPDGRMLSRAPGKLYLTVLDRASLKDGVAVNYSGDSDLFVTGVRFVSMPSGSGPLVILVRYPR